MQIAETVDPEVLVGDCSCLFSVSDRPLAHSRAKAKRPVERQRLDLHSLVVDQLTGPLGYAPGATVGTMLAQSKLSLYEPAFAKQYFPGTKLMIEAADPHTGARRFIPFNDAASADQGVGGSGGTSDSRDTRREDIDDTPTEDPRPVPTEVLR